MTLMNGVGRIIDKPQELLLDVYILQSILPQYDAFDGGHKRDHAETVIRESLKLARAYDADLRRLCREWYDKQPSARKKSKKMT